MQISVVLVPGPGLLGDLLERLIERDPRFHVVARLDRMTSVVRHLRRCDFDAVIVSTPDGSIPALGERLLEQGACRTVLAVSPDGRDATLSSVARGELALRNPWPDELLASIRAAVDA